MFPVLGIEAMVGVMALLCTSLALIWSTKEFHNVCFKLVFIIMAVWSGLNFISMLWFNGLSGVA